MLEIIPIDLLYIIIRFNSGVIYGYHMNMEIDIREIVKLRYVNKRFRDIIDNITNIWNFKELKKITNYYNKIHEGNILKWCDYNYNKYLSIDEQVTELCKKHTSEETFEWLFRNNIYLSLNNLKNLIIYNRLHVIKICLKYKENCCTIFNRFHYGEIMDKNDDILSMKESLHPLIIAAKYGRIDIIDLLLNYTDVPNFFYKEIYNIFKLSIKYNNEGLLSYLIVKYGNNISNIPYRVPTIINRVDKCEGLLFYLINTHDIEINQKILNGCIIKNYFELFKYCYENILKTGIYDNMNIYLNNKTNIKINTTELIGKCIQYNNNDILNYIFINMEYITITPIQFNLYFFRKKEYTKEFIENIVRVHKNYIKKESKLIKLCIKYGLHDLIIKDLIFNKFKYTNEDIKTIIDNNQYDLAEYMCKWKKK